MEWSMVTEGMLGAGVAGLIARVVGKVIFALLVWLIGKHLIAFFLKVAERNQSAKRLDPMVHRFLRSFLKAVLYIVLLISIIGILGVPMASVVAVLASAGVAIGLALQGSLSNLAGGIMLLIFKPFRVGDYVDAAGASGTVQEVNLFYTVLLSIDNRRITIPNGSLMNANVENYSAEPLRRVDLKFRCAKSEDLGRIRTLMLEKVKDQEKVLHAPAEPFAGLTGESDEAMEFSVRVWCNTEDYWDIYYDLLESIAESFRANDVKIPTSRILMKTE